MFETQPENHFKTHSAIVDSPPSPCLKYTHIYRVHTYIHMEAIQYFSESHTIGLQYTAVEHATRAVCTSLPPRKHPPPQIHNNTTSVTAIWTGVHPHQKAMLVFYTILQKFNCNLIGVHRMNFIPIKKRCHCYPTSPPLSLPPYGQMYKTLLERLFM